VLFNTEDDKAVRSIQRIVRGFVGRMRARKLVSLKYARYYDANQRKFFWLEKSSQKTFWVVSDWLTKQDIPLPQEDQLLYDSHMKIKVNQPIPSIGG